MEIYDKTGAFFADFRNVWKSTTNQTIQITQSRTGGLQGK